MAGAAARRGRAGGRLARERTASSTAVIAHIASLFLLALSAAVVVCALIGLAFIAWNDSRRSVERHAALRLALDEIHAVFGHGERFEDGRLRLIERRAGLKGLRFATEPPATGAREVQSLHDSEGRIIGWFSWEPDRGLARVMKALWVLVAVAGAGLAGGSFVAAGAGLRLDRLLAQTAETVRKLTEEDALTALPSQRAMLKRLEGALASRRSGTVVLALIDLDAFREFKETLGRAGGDAALKQIAEHLNAAVPAGALLGRFEDDEFAVITSSDQTEEAAVLDAALRGALPSDPGGSPMADHSDHRSGTGAR